MKGTAINRSDLMQQLADKYQLEPRDAETIVRVIIERMSQALIAGERIEIRGFGSFELRFRKPRKARNPKTGDEVFTVGKYSIHFKPGKEMRERVNDSLNGTPAPEQPQTAQGWQSPSSSSSDDDSNSQW